MTTTEGTSYADLLRAQIRNEFNASQQYVAMAVWFDARDLPSEQVEEVAATTTLLTIAERAGTDWFEVETYLARAAVGDAGVSSGPASAGGVL